MAPNPRVLNAFRAMRDLGIIEEKTKPVLKKLLIVYEKNWELIEAENYRALADAILEEEEMEAAEDRRKPEKPNRDEVLEEETQIHEEPVRPLKRLRLKHQDDLASPSSDNSSPFLGATALKKPKVEADELGQAHPTAPQETNSQKLTVIQSVPSPLVTRSKGKQPVLSQSLTVQERCVPSQNPPADTCLDVMKRTALNINSSPLRLRDREEGAPLPQNVQRDKSFISESSSQGVHFMEPMVEVGKTLLPKQKDLKNITLIEPKDEPFTDEIPEFEVPLAVFRPDPLPQGNSSSGNACIDEPDGQPTSDPNARNEGIPVSSLELTKTPEEASANLEMASSASGEVKISLSCNSIIGRPGFRMPSLDEFSQTVEDSCLRSYKFLDKSFSVKNLMKDMCECFLELGTDSYSKFQEIVNVTPALDLVNNNAALDSVISMGRPIIPSNGPSNMPLDTEVAIPRMPANEIVEHDDGGKIHCMVNKASEIDDLDHGNSQSIGVFQKQQSAENAKSLDDFNDIAKGHESVKISYANEVNSECPPSFHYIPRNVVFQNAYVNFSLARIGESCCETCSGDCLLSLTPCACTCETGGEYAYTLEGLVKEELLEECISMNRDPKKHCLFYCKVCPLERSKNEDTSEPCKGHLVRKFIKECWWKCGCSKQCGNRVVQRGINRKLQVFMTPGGKGWGIRTLEDLPKGAFVCEYVGEVLTNAELYDRVSESSDNQSHSYPVLLDADWGSEGVLKDDEALCLDATHYGNVARFINHRCFDSTMVEIPVEVETPDHHYYHLAFFTTRKVKALEELTWDYGIDFDDHEHPVKAFRCRCGSKFCRNIKRSSRSRRK